MRALVISDSHLGAWTGEDLLAHDQYLERLAPHLDDIDELIVLGDLVDLLFGSIEDAFSAAQGLFDLAAEKLQGKRLVFIAGNHDHRFVVREAEDLLEMEIATGSPAAELRDEVARGQMPRLFLERRLEGVEIDVQYPTYTFAGVLCTHGHYLDPHARLAGPLGSRLLTKALWAIASGGPEQPRTVADYESVITLLTEMLYTIAQLPHGTTAQRNVFRTRGTIARFARAAGAPVRAVERLAARIRESGGGGGATGSDPSSGVTFDDYLREQAAEAERRRGRATPAIPHDVPGYDVARTVRPGDPRGRALEAIAQVVQNLGWARDTDKIVFAHTHQPIADARVPLTGEVRYWNTGSWIYEPELGSHDAYLRYLRNAWPGTGVVIDSEQEAPSLIAPLADLNPLVGGPGIVTSKPSVAGEPGEGG